MGCFAARAAIFLSTPSARRATPRLYEPRRMGCISIHALREEGDSTAGSCPARWSDFYPRPPRGGRHVALGLFNSMDKFLSTPSARRATPR